MITKPTLPAIRGYVEVEVDGVRTYRNIRTGLLIDEEKRLAMMAEVEEPEEVVDETAIEPEVAETEPVIGETDNAEVSS